MFWIKSNRFKCDASVCLILSKKMKSMKFVLNGFNRNARQKFFRKFIICIWLIQMQIYWVRWNGMTSTYTLSYCLSNRPGRCQLCISYLNNRSIYKFFFFFFLCFVEKGEWKTSVSRHSFHFEKDKQPKRKRKESMWPCQVIKR